MLVKNTFRKEIKEILIEAMLQGEIEPGIRISLPELAKKLEVSVTPIREALTQLTEIGIVTYIPNRGFFVTELTKNEASDIFEVITILECKAIEKAAYSDEQLIELRKINRAFEQTTEPTQKLKLDMEFHQKLIESYSNVYLKKIIEDIRTRIFMYELHFMVTQPIQTSAQMHNNILDALENGNRPKAMEILHANWSLSIQNILATYKSKDICD
jgi:DNA-binding GntR family transcriptional regulator